MSTSFAILKLDCQVFEMSLNTLFRWKWAWENRQQKATFIYHWAERSDEYSTYFFNLEEIQFDLGTTTKNLNDYLQLLFLIIYLLNITDKLGERSVNNFDGFVDEEDEVIAELTTFRNVFNAMEKKG